MTLPFAPPGSLRPLRPHQERALEALRLSLTSGKRRPMLQAPTGAGKTLLAAHIIARALDKGKRIAFCVPRLTLIDQTVAAFEAEGIEGIGVMQGCHYRTDETQPVQVCSAQTLNRRKRPEVDLVLVDEAHELHKSILTWLTDPSIANVPCIGLSATPWARGLGRYYDALVIAATTRDLIRDGYLSDFIAYAPSEPDLSDVSTLAGEFKQDELGDAMDKAQITGDIVETWLKRGDNRPTVAFCVNRNHAKHVFERFEEAGVAVEYLDGETPREDRERIFARFKSCETSILVSVGVLTTGFDADVRCMIDAQPTRSRIDFVQKIGRGLRTAPGKDRLIVLDHAGNFLRLGLVTDIGQDHLDDGKQREGSAKKERGEALPRLCPQCTAVLPRNARACSACGLKLYATSLVRAADGDLVEIGSRQRGQRSLTEAEKRTFFSELQGLRKEHYKLGWTAAQFRNRFGHWPPPDYDHLPTLSPSLATRNWLKSRQIAFARRAP